MERKHLAGNNEDSGGTGGELRQLKASSEQLFLQLIIAVGEQNEGQAVRLAEKQIAAGMTGKLTDMLTEWKFYLVRVLTIYTWVICERNVIEQYPEELESMFLKRIDEVESVEQCTRLFLEMTRKYCRLDRKVVRSSSSLVRKIITAVETDLTQPLTLQYFSEILNVNSSYLSNLFRQETGITITEYVTARRIVHASDLLRYTGIPVNAVAKQAGIPDVQYFSRLFKRRVGMTPTQFRDSTSNRNLRAGDES